MAGIKLSTTVNLPKSDVQITHQTALFLIGSCFTESIGERLNNLKFSVGINPNGIIYNPISVVNSLNRTLKNKPYSEKELLSFQNKWLSLAHHGSFSATNKEECLTKINNSLVCSHQQLKKAEVVIITLGSAWVYEYEKFGIVANCHKIPGKEFNKKLLSVKEIITAFENFLPQLKNKQVIFTVSPVRHAKDGLHENNLSKSTLLLAINNLVNQYANCHYFPAYELIIDELRDYRFYKDDLVHPTEMAINYVWEKFGETYFDKDTLLLNEALQKVIQMVNHRPFEPDSVAHQKFNAALINTIKNINADFPDLNFGKELAQIQS